MRLDSAAFSAYRSVPNREDREKVMAAFFSALGQYKATFGATLSTQIQSDVFYAKARKYDSALQAALDGPNIPTPCTRTSLTASTTTSRPFTATSNSVNGC